MLVAAAALAVSTMSSPNEVLLPLEGESEDAMAIQVVELVDYVAPGAP